MGKKRTAPEIHPRFRILCGPDIAIGPGKAELLDQVQATKSIARAAKRMKMSYVRAWTLIKTMERCLWNADGSFGKGSPRAFSRIFPRLWRRMAIPGGWNG